MPITGGGFLDKTDGTYLSAWLLPSLLHEDTRFYALGNTRSVPVRALYVLSRQAVARTYGGRQTPNIAGTGGQGAGAGGFAELLSSGGDRL